MRDSARLTYNGNCETALEYYERTIGGKLEAMVSYHADAPPEMRGKIIHATLLIGDSMLNGADVLANDYHTQRGFYVLLSTETVAESQQIFGALAEKGKIEMALQRTFWSPAFGVLVDKFGTPWEVS